LSSIRVMVALDRSVAVRSGGIQLLGARTSAPRAIRRAAAAAWQEGHIARCTLRHGTITEAEPPASCAIRCNSLIKQSKQDWCA